MSKDREAASPEGVLKRYEADINQRDFDLVAPLISAEAVFWFNDGSFTGLPAIRAAFERTWAGIADEIYWLDDLAWIAKGDSVAACTYRFCWRGVVAGEVRTGGGRGTSVFHKQDDGWKIVHEHLSAEPEG